MGNEELVSERDTIFPGKFFVVILFEVPFSLHLLAQDLQERNAAKLLKSLPNSGFASTIHTQYWIQDITDGGPVLAVADPGFHRGRQPGGGH